jgi:hypothetical protein
LLNVAQNPKLSNVDGDYSLPAGLRSLIAPYAALTRLPLLTAPSLTRLLLHDNAITGTLPPSFPQKLVHLTLFHNFFTGTVPMLPEALTTCLLYG